MRPRRPVRASLAWVALFFVLASAGGALAQSAVSGTITFEDGTPAAGARVSLAPGGYNTTTDSGGNFSLEAPPGNYTLRATAVNVTTESPVSIGAGFTTGVPIRLDRHTGGGSIDAFPFLFLILSMVGVALGGFYVNKRMAESGIDVNKTVVGGASVRKPFRRRKKVQPPRSGGPSP